MLLKYAYPVRADIQGNQLPGSHCVSVTIDDGFCSALENAVPELMKRGIPFTIFVPSGFLGKTADWLKCEKDLKETVIGDEDLNKIKNNSLATIGSHCITHRNLCELDENVARKEICESKQVLENLLGAEVHLLSFPYGSFNQIHIEFAKEAGYKRVFTTVPETALMTTNEFSTGRISVEPTDSILEYYLKIHGCYRWLPVAIRLKRKLLSNILFGEL